MASDLKRILITGSRMWSDQSWLEREIETAIFELGPSVLVHGACPTGADAIADAWAQENSIELERHPADWDAHGRAAGPIRNREMVALGADLCLAFVHRSSRGASGCAEMAAGAGIPVRRFESA